MKRVKLVGFAAMVGVASAALVGAGEALAETTLCKAAESPCSEASRYPLATEFEAVSIPGLDTKNVTLTAPSESDPGFSCDAKMTGQIETATTPTIKLATTWENCQGGTEVKTTTNGEITFHHDAEHNASVTVKGLTVSYSTGLSRCSYTGELAGTLTGSTTEPIIHITQLMKRDTAHPNGLFCSINQPAIHATLKVKKPTPLYASTGA